jgi:hypothetical protein
MIKASGTSQRAARLLWLVQQGLRNWLFERTYVPPSEGIARGHLTKTIKRPAEELVYLGAALILLSLISTFTPRCYILL